MAVLVTGASGLLGLRLVRRLAAAGRDVIAIHRSALPSDALQDRLVTWMQRDLAQGELDAAEFPSVDAVVHLAGTGWGRGTRPDEKASAIAFLEANERTTVNVLEAFAPRVRRIVLASSQVVYGWPDSIDVTEELPLRPAGAYAVSKANAERWAAVFQARYGGSYRVLRLCGFIDSGGVVDYLIEQALANRPIELFAAGTIRRDYLRADEGARAIALALEAGLDDGLHPINVGSGQAIPAKRLAEIVCAALESESTIVPIDKPSAQGDFVFNVTHARRTIGFAADNLEQSVHDYARARAKEATL